VILLPDATRLVKLIKQTAIEAVKAEKPVNICFGKVTSISPLKILVEQKLTLSKAQLVQSKTVADYGLAIGDEVILLRQQGGQKFVVADKIA